MALFLFEMSEIIYLIWYVIVYIVFVLFRLHAYLNYWVKFCYLCFSVKYISLVINIHIIVFRWKEFWSLTICPWIFVLGTFVSGFFVSVIFVFYEASSSNENSGTNNRICWFIMLNLKWKPEFLVLSKFLDIYIFCPF